MTGAIRAAAEADPAMVVWWATEVECASAIARLERQGDLTSEATQAALARLDAIADGWHQVEPGEVVQRAARRVLRIHELRAGDAFQLAAAIVASENQPESLEFVSLDERLVVAARREGFSVHALVQSE